MYFDQADMERIRVYSVLLWEHLESGPSDDAWEAAVEARDAEWEKYSEYDLEDEDLMMIEGTSEGGVYIHYYLSPCGLMYVDTVTNGLGHHFIYRTPIDKKKILGFLYAAPGEPVTSRTALILEEEEE